jgi:hypothetical protein
MEDVDMYHGPLVYFIAIRSILLPFGLFYCHLVYFTASWSILLPFGLFYCHLVYFTAIWSNLWPFDILYGHLVCFSHFGMLHQEKSGNPAFVTKCNEKKLITIFNPPAHN